MLGSLAAGVGSEWLGLIASGPAALMGWREIEPVVADQRRTAQALSAVARFVRARDGRTA